MMEIAERDVKKVPTLRGRTVVNLFLEESTRTRISFEIAAKRLSADTINLSGKGSSVSKGETLADTARNLQAMSPDAIVIRHPGAGAARLLAEHHRLSGDQCRRRPSRASDPGASRSADHSPAQARDRRHHRHDRRRHPSLARRALESPRLADARRESPALRAADTVAAGVRLARRRALLRPRERGARRRRDHDAASPARAAGRQLLPDPRRVRALLLPHRRNAGRGQARRDHPSPRPDEPRHRDRERRRRRAVLRNDEPGGQRGRDADGRALPADRARRRRHSRQRRRASRAWSRRCHERASAIAEAHAHSRRSPDRPGFRVQRLGRSIDRRRSHRSARPAREASRRKAARSSTPAVRSSCPA